MGRRAKYLTLDDKMAALRQQKAAYSRTERGKAARQAQNARAYMKHHRRRGTTKSAESESVPQSSPKSSPAPAPAPLPAPEPKPKPKPSPTVTTTPPPPSPLPSSILTLANLPLPNSFLFHQALRGSHLIDESDLPQWDKPPPYTSTPPPDTPAEAQFTRNLVDVMHGRRLRLEREGVVVRGRKFEIGEIGAGRGALREVERRLLDEWEWGKEFVKSGDICERHRIMAECWRQWQARRIFRYRQEADSLDAGRNPYLCVDQV
ncbi:uncharacterized protein EDB91DRAFT_1085813 [Suillus paluster]|uniref:uncharacterized protein n=1 Tax=Suillus paluster TaxID=48578 RepID=UPI001B87BE43|nr:uncharacterized protein EDB91DRAFT_1085813 [Suillus paluster]KAG1729201.1 hypothetical protein EDB91DRAFT_1085813 [Suillus paluster]